MQFYFNDASCSHNNLSELAQSVLYMGWRFSIVITQPETSKSVAGLGENPPHFPLVSKVIVKVDPLTSLFNPEARQTIKQMLRKWQNEEQMEEPVSVVEAQCYISLTWLWNCTLFTSKDKMLVLVF